MPNVYSTTKIMWIKKYKKMKNKKKDNEKKERLENEKRERERKQNKCTRCRKTKENARVLKMHVLTVARRNMSVYLTNRTSFTLDKAFAWVDQRQPSVRREVLFGLLDSFLSD